MKHKHSHENEEFEAHQENDINKIEDAAIPADLQNYSKLKLMFADVPE